MYKPITFDEQVLAGDKLQFHFSFSDVFFVVRPTEQDLLGAADQAQSFNVSSVKYSLGLGSLAGENGYVQGTVSETTTPNDIADDIRQQFANFKTVRGVQIDEVDKDTFSASDLAPSIPTTVSLAAIAVIAIVILVVFLKVS